MDKTTIARAVDLLVDDAADSTSPASLRDDLESALRGVLTELETAGSLEIVSITPGDSKRGLWF